MTFAIGARRVKDYAEWKRGFDEGADLRKASGVKTYRIFQTINDPNMILVLAEFDSPEAAQKFLQSAELREAEKAAGVVEKCETIDTSKFLIEADAGRCD